MDSLKFHPFLRVIRSEQIDLVNPNMIKLAGLLELYRKPLYSGSDLWKRA